MYESHNRRNSTAERKAEAVAKIEQMIKSGMKVRVAVEEVAFRSGVGERTLFTCLRKTRGVPNEKWTDELARKPQKARPRATYHPDAMMHFIDLCRTGALVTECYRRTVVKAADKGWDPIPSERTLRRELDRQVPWVERYAARRANKPKGEV